MADIANRSINNIIQIGEVEIQQPSKREADWYVIKQQSFKINKEQYILKQLEKDYPHIKVVDYNQFNNLLSRSKKLQEWYSLVNIMYADSVQLPVAFKEMFEPDEYQRYFDDLQSYKKSLADESTMVEIKTREFNNDLNDLRKEYQNERNEIVNKNKYYPILTMTKQQLPLTIQLQIENYSPKDGDITQRRDQYAQEMLISYKKALIQKVKNNPELDIIKLIDEMQEK